MTTEKVNISKIFFLILKESGYIWAGYSYSSSQSKSPFMCLRNSTNHSRENCFTILGCILSKDFKIFMMKLMRSNEIFRHKIPQILIRSMSIAISCPCYLAFLPAPWY